MKKRIEAIVIRLRMAVRQHPVEVILSVVFSLLACYYYETEYEYDSLLRPLVYFPVLFLTTYTLNGMTLHKPFRWLYYLSAFFCVPLFFWPMLSPVWTPAYLVSLIVVQLFYLVSGWKKENDEFAQVALRYLKAMLSAGLLAGIAYLLAISIYMSILYIFEIWKNSERDFLVEASYLIFICGMPLLFLMFNQEREEKDNARNRLFDVLLNYVLSPALLIYAAILYLYFIKIIVLWSLPKGAVAYIVVSFILATFILKGCQVFLTKRYYDWFYRYASWVVLPALAMYWVGVYYRINQYGFTEPRVYLVVAGAILTALVILFFTKRWASYLYAACLAIVFLSVVTYIPGITAKNIEIRSQTARGNYPYTDYQPDYLSYLELNEDSPIDISGYHTLLPVRGYNSQDHMWTKTENDTFYLYNKEELLYSEDLSSLWNRQLAQNGIASGDTIPKEAYSKLLQLDMDSAKLVFQYIGLSRNSPDSTYRISYMSPAYYLKK